VRSSRRRRRRSHTLLAAAIIVLVVAGLGGATDLGYTVVKARADQLQSRLSDDLQAGQRELEAGKTSLTLANTNHDGDLVTAATNHFAVAKGHFQEAGQLADNSELLRNLERLPTVGDAARSRHTAVDGISAMGIAISDAGRALSDLDGQLIKPPAAGSAGHTLLTALNQAHTSLTAVRGDLSRAQTAADTVDVHVLPVAQQATFLKARDTIDVALAGLDEFERLVPVLNEVLGANGARTYLVEQVNPAELRAGGGFIGTYSLIQADKGVLTVTNSGDSYDLINPRPVPGQRGFIPQPSPLREVVPNVGWSFVDSNVYPDFPTNAKTAENFVQPRVGKIDAVISIDYYTVAAMLSLTGPITLPGIGTLNADNFVSRIVSLDVAASANHKTVLAAVAGPLMERVTALHSDQWPALIGVLNTLASQRHLQAYFSDVTVETEIDRVGWSGTLRPTGAADFIMEVEANYWGNKTNYFLTRRFSVVLTKAASTVHHVVTVDIANATVCGSEDRTSYKANVRLFVSGTATNLSNNLRAVKYANPAPPAGTQAADGWLPDVNCGGGRGQARFTYDTPWVSTGRGVHEIYWQKQPGTLTDSISITWNPTTGPSFVVNGTLDHDQIIALSPTGASLVAGQPAKATLPSLTFG
jgi:hypothetical protein